MIFEKCKDYTPVICDKAKEFCDSARDGIGLLDRYRIKKNVSVRFQVYDSANGKRLADTENEWTREFSALKALCAVMLAFVGVVAFITISAQNMKSRKKYKTQKKELKKIKKICKKADIELPEEA